MMSPVDLSITIWEVALRLVMAVVFAGVIGWERESRRRPAGLRTHMLVGLGCAGFMIVALEFLRGIQAMEGATVSADPMKMIAGIASGVGFLGAGAIIQARGEVRGLTTAAGIWCVAAIGVAAGCGLFIVSTLIFALAFVTLGVLRGVEVKMPLADDDEKPDDQQADNDPSPLDKP